MAVSAIPDGFHAVTPYLVVQGAHDLIRFLKQAFNAVEEHRSTDAEGRILHAQLRVGDSVVMLGDSGKDFDPMPGMLYLYVEDVDVVFQRALQSGATVIQEPADQFYGDRCGAVRDSSGNQWWIASRKEIVPPDELMRRQNALESSEASSREVSLWLE